MSRIAGHSPRERALAWRASNREAVLLAEISAARRRLAAAEAEGAAYERGRQRTRRGLLRSMMLGLAEVNAESRWIR